MSVISQNNAHNLQKRFINFYYTHEGRHEGLYTNNDNYEDATPSSQVSDWLIASSELLVVDEVLHSRVLL
jgi:hypothetical protein